MFSFLQISLNEVQHITIDFKEDNIIRFNMHIFLKIQDQRYVNQPKQSI